jgi:hypothetical protein
MRRKTNRNIVKKYNRYVRKLRFLLEENRHSRKIYWLRKRLRKLSVIIETKINNYQLRTKRIVTTAFVAAAVTAGVQAQGFELKLNSANPFYEVVNTGYAKPHFVDFDSDGDDDMFLTGFIGSPAAGIRDRGLQYYENVEGSFELAASVPFPEDLGIGELLQSDAGDVLRLSMDFVDYDGDGDIDAFANSYEGIGIAYLENVDGSFTANSDTNPFSDIGVTVDENGETDLGEVELGDINGDGVLEAIVVNNDSISVYNLEEGKFVKGEFIASGFEMATNLTDYDGDADLDLIVGNKYGTIDIYENNGGDFTLLNEHDFTSVLLQNNPTPASADINGDGNLDIIIGMDSGSLRYFEKEEEEYKYVPYNPRDVHFYGAVAPIPEFVDLDADGDKDLLIGTELSLTRFIENTDEVFNRNEDNNPFNVDSGISLLEADPNCGDIDNDGDIDCHFFDAFDGFEQYFENVDGSYMLADSLDNPIVEFSSSENTQVVFEDFDGDGDLDVFIGNKYGEVFYYDNVDGVYTANQDAISGLTLGDDASYLYFGDTDNDGDNDLAVINPEGGLDYYMKSENGLTKMEGDDNPFKDLSADIISLAFYDLDGDGDQDILGVDGLFRAIYLENQLTQSSVETELYSSETKIFPNPASNSITVEMPWVSGKAEIHIYNVNGQFIRRQSSNNDRMTIDVSDFASGNYHLRIVDGEKVAIQKFAIIK